MILMAYFEALLLKFTKTEDILKLYFFIWSTITIANIIKTVEI